MALFPSFVLQGFLGFNEAVSDMSLTFDNVMFIIFCLLAYTLLDEEGCWQCVHPGLHSARYQVCIVPVIVIVCMLYSPSQGLGGLDGFTCYRVRRRPILLNRARHRQIVSYRSLCRLIVS